LSLVLSCRYNVMERCWLDDPSARPTATSVIKELTSMMVALGDKGGEIRDVGRLVSEGDGSAEEEEEEVTGFGDSGDGAGGGGAEGCDDGGRAYAYSEPGALQEQQQQQPASLVGATKASRDSVALNSTEWDELNALLDAFDN
jgi:hypothetical protein